MAASKTPPADLGACVCRLHLTNVTENPCPSEGGNHPRHGTSQPAFFFGDLLLDSAASAEDRLAGTH
jgi:hypothetical protein